MSLSTLVFLALRATHVLLAATWLGATAFVAFFLLPAIVETGPGSAPMMGAIARRGLNGFMGILGGLTVLSGIYLYWRFTGGFDPSLSATRSAMVFGTGGISGILSVIVGGAVVGRNARRMGELGGKAMSMPEGPPRAALMAEMAAARGRALTGGRILLVLQTIALVCMAIGHYV